MDDGKTIPAHYQRGNLLNQLQVALVQLGKTPERITIEELAAVDEFHVGGRLATKHLIDQLNFSENHRILDVGCGLGGAARYVASTTNSAVVGIDLTKEFVDTGNTLCAWTRLEEKVTLREGNILAMPFPDNYFDGAYMLHVGMSIEDKRQLFGEMGRVLRPAASFGIYDLMRVKEGELNYPVPWASEAGMNYLAKPNQYEKALTDAGFDVSIVNNRRQFILKLFKDAQANRKPDAEPPVLGLHLIMGADTAVKAKNMIQALTNELIAPVEIIAHNRG